MSIGLAWVGKRSDGLEHLYIASDSRIRGGQRLDACPKIFTLPRSDCALCFAGDTAFAYPFMIQLAYAIAAHEPARDRGLDIARVKAHLSRVFSDLVARIEDPAAPFSKTEVEFIFAGYSWRKKDFRIWTIRYQEKEKQFEARESKSFLPRLKKVAFVGDWTRRVRSSLTKELSTPGQFAYLEPLKVLANYLKDAQPNGTIGGSPQLIRINQHMNTRPLCVRWRGEDTLLGRPLFNYENTDYWIVEPFSGRFAKPRKFGLRDPDLALNSETANVESANGDEVIS